MRDIAFAYLRNAERTPKDIDQAEEFISQAEIRHKGDWNRIAVLEGARGRVAFARSLDASDAIKKNTLLEKAVGHHRKAKSLWYQYAKTADKQWEFNNLLPLMEALAALGRMEEVNTIGREVLSLSGEYGTQQHIDRAYALMTAGGKKVRPNAFDAETVNIQDNYL